MAGRFYESVDATDSDDSDSPSNESNQSDSTSTYDSEDNLPLVRILDHHNEAADDGESVGILTPEVIQIQSSDDDSDCLGRDMDARSTQLIELRWVQNSNRIGRIFFFLWLELIPIEFDFLFVS